jgi:hypothetical protein
MSRNINFDDVTKAVADYEQVGSAKGIKVKKKKKAKKVKKIEESVEVPPQIMIGEATEEVTKTGKKKKSKKKST